jgi:hypothetical protein
MSKLSHGELHLMRLLARDTNAEGWTTVSRQVWPLVVSIPDELRELKPIKDAGFARLTVAGYTVLQWL